jgi:hypothetical protein
MDFLEGAKMKQQIIFGSICVLVIFCIVGLTQMPSCKPPTQDCVNDMDGECVPIEQGCSEEDVIILPNSCELGFICCGPLNPEGSPF